MVNHWNTGCIIADFCVELLRLVGAIYTQITVFIYKSMESASSTNIYIYIDVQINTCVSETDQRSN